MIKDVDKLQAIYDSETNIRLEWIWDEGITAKVDGESALFDTVADAVDWLYEQAGL